MNNISIRTGFASLSPEEQDSHRVKIGVRASAILSQFWQDADTPEPVQVLEIEGWQDVLENCSHSEIRAAWTAYQKDGPRTKAGRLYKPDAGALYQIILRARPKPQLVKPAPEPERVRVTAEQANAIIEEEDFHPELLVPKKFGGET